MNSVRLHSAKPSVLSAVALFRALAPERRHLVRDMLVRHVQENTAWIQSLLDPKQQVDVSLLNSGLQKFGAVVSKVGKDQVRFVPGDGALYGILDVADASKEAFLESAKQQNLTLIPGAIFYGGRQDVAELLATPQKTYRLSLMADPGQRV